MKIQIFGSWNMWEIVLNSFLKSNVSNKDIFVKTKTRETEEKIEKKYKINIWINYKSEIIILAIKPNQFKELDLSKFQKNVLIMSLMVWISTKNINFNKIIRIMPNTPMLVNKWVIWFFSTKKVSQTELKFFKNIFEKAWVLIELKNEDEINKITALSWSWPAYYYLFTEIIEDKAKSMWFSEENAKLIAYNTFIWAANLLESSNEEIRKLREKITSPWWTTQEAIVTLKNNNFEQSLYEAIDNAYYKAKKLNTK